jgi:nicotinamide-nucleotide amidase
VGAARSDLILVTGGLGPTRDDITRQVIAEFCGVPLELDEPSLAHIRDLFARRRVPMPENNKIQAMIPKGAAIVSNPRGTAAGFAIKAGKAEIISLPGVPSEMKAMFEGWVLPHLAQRTGPRGVKITRLLHAFGMAESAVGEKIHHLMAPGRNPNVGTMVHEGIITVRINASGDTPEEASRLLGATEGEVRRILGDVIFGADGEEMEHAVARLLKERKLTVAVAESCTGGLVGHKLTNVPGISEWFLEGVVAYSNRAKTDLLGVPQDMVAAVGAVSAEVAAAMASGIRRRSGADVALGLTGIAGPTGGTPEKPVGLVFVALAKNSGLETRELRLVGTRAMIKDRAAKSGLNMLRLSLMGDTQYATRST